ncbi:hypothetical protein [Natronorubrum aibiense]|uniref:DUF8215 domain-containing protein n=1 Tax=Natronorubrum aibiense TaxID=348826 RepID=A0A5P9P570_9EURY|nr:hypothetical protein [Natronorubrum aibiense]QFU83294.1 hypothetical protein GCU68_12495 [Natronorubrum aibiense]
MSPPSDSHGSERRRLRSTADRREHVIDSVVFYGLGQVLVLTTLWLWYVYQSPFRRGDVVLGTIVALSCLPLGIGLRRQRAAVGTVSWPKIDDVTLGIGDGYRRCLARGVLLSAIIGIAAYGAAAVGTVTTTALAPAAVALASVVAGVRVFPELVGLKRRARGRRIALYAIALAGGFYFGAPFASGVGFHSAYVLYPLLVALGVLDAIL